MPKIPSLHHRPESTPTPRMRQGFTIVELLIVIVVIGVLAAITVVAYNGIQDRARLATALSFEHQIRSKYGADVTGDWNFDECSGATAKNISGTATSDAISGGAPTWITDTPTGKGCAIHFDGTVTHIETTASLGSTYYVKAAWVRISVASCGSYNIISQALTNGASAAFYTPSCKPSAGHNGAWGSAASTQTINDNKWHYVTAIWENSAQTLTLYVDGKSVAVGANVAVAPNSTGYVGIGSHAGGNFFNGDIDNPFVAAQ